MRVVTARDFTRCLRQDQQHGGAVAGSSPEAGKCLPSPSRGCLVAMIMSTERTRRIRGTISEIQKPAYAVFFFGSLGSDFTSGVVAGLASGFFSPEVLLLPVSVLAALL